MTAMPEADKVRRLSERCAAQRSEFSRAPLQASTARGPSRSEGAIIGSPFLAYFFWRSKRSRSPAGANSRPGHDDSAIGLGHQVKDVTAKQQLLLKLKVLFKTL